MCIFAALNKYHDKENMKKPLILVSNDDGVQAKGIGELVRTLRPLGDVVVMAPDAPRSGAGCSLTAAAPVRFREVRCEEGLRVYSCSGTPTDCVKLALATVLDGHRPDLVAGGINHGDNSAVNVHYSGTMGVVLEGCMKGIPSVGFSLCDHRPDADFKHAVPYVRRIAEEVLRRGLPEGVCLNVNFPAVLSYKGVKVCRQTRGQWTNEWAERHHPNGESYYWLTGDFEPEEREEGSDRRALEEGCVAITPTQIDMTAYGMIKELEQWKWEE